MNAEYQKVLTSAPAVLPFSEPPYLAGLPSPYHNDSHRHFQKVARAWISENITKHALEWEREESVPEDLYQRWVAAGFLPATLPAPLPVDWLKRLGIHEMPGSVKVEDWNYTHSAIFADEMMGAGLAGPPGSLTVGVAYGLPPIFKFGSKELQERVVPEIVLGKKRICIAITEPDAGSDVANITTTAKKTPDGKHYIVNGQKKWITNGIWSDYATMAVRTGDEGAGGLSLLLVPLKGHPGVEMRRLKVGGQISAGTTFIDMDEVKVPVENLIGQEGLGMTYIMTNFNHERMSICMGVVRQCRVALSTAFEYVMKREAFGKTLIDNAVVRHRLAGAGSQLEAYAAWVDQLVYQMGNMSKAESDLRLGGAIAMAKALGGRVFDEVASCSVLLFGGNGYTRSGQGEIVEKIYREVPGMRIPGGSEDVLLDLGIRQLLKIYQLQTQLLGTKSNL
ncbi:acyl-CoA dehydrogenase [Cordyceps militaris CM01]|uniref:Acyl-CoA dehydrogenase n=2 Tax=Cordyceps militaris TaxID=73501 RepID=G3J946_CORMM|nr:acyl-CoA dehydrogenase [Cordyceps militaris CM01]ATY59875.1 acyl-dehydrogenase [Cordyceps militaris]EGX94875.1 acyl-CoA dehydrogenase [Cordyceps militaris CM01]